MSLIINVNSSHVVSNQNSSFVYPCIQGGLTFPKGTTMSVRSLTIPYAFVNISQALYTNATFRYTWVDAQVYTVVLAAGYYSISDINLAFVQAQITNGHYLLNSAGDTVTYLNLYLNENLYSVQLISALVPTSLPSGYTAPVAFTYAVGSPITATFTVLANGFVNAIGFLAGSYGGASAVAVSTLSNTLVQGSPVQALNISCNLIQNRVTNPSNILDGFGSTGVSYGSNIVYNPPFKSEVAVVPGTYSSISFSILDQNFNQITSLDPTVSLVFLIDIPDGDSSKQMMIK